MLGCSPEDFHHYKQFTDLVHPDDVEPMMQDMRDHLEGRNKQYETSYRIKHKDGHYIHFIDRGKIVGQRDGKQLLAGFVFDSREYKHAFDRFADTPES